MLGPLGVPALPAHCPSAGLELEPKHGLVSVQRLSHCVPTPVGLCACQPLDPLEPLCPCLSEMALPPSLSGLKAPTGTRILAPLARSKRDEIVALNLSRWALGRRSGGEASGWAARWCGHRHLGFCLQP